MILGVKVFVFTIEERSPDEHEQFHDNGWKEPSIKHITPWKT